jgi:DNA-directed RNA polymerase
VGGYYSQSTLIMRFSKGFEQERSLIHQNQDRVYRVLDMIGKQTWRINRPVLAVIRRLWEEGGGLCEIPPRTSSISANID